MPWIGEPGGRKSHEPLHELGCWTRATLVLQERGRWRDSSGDVFPAGHGVGIASPAVKMSSVSDHNVSESLCLLSEPSGPWSTRSMIWCERAIVPRLAFTLSKVSPPRSESDASGVRNSVLAAGEEEDAEPGVRSADKGSR